MSNNLEKLIKDGFADLKSEIKGVKEEISNVKSTADNNTKKIEDQASELADLKEQMTDLIRSDQDLRRRAGRRTLVISGNGLPDYDIHEDTYAVAINAIFTITGLNMGRKEFHNVHRHGRYSERIFAEFIYTGMLHDVLSPQHYRKSLDKKIFLNIFQPTHDRRLASIARRMRYEKVIAKTFVKANGLTVVVPLESSEKVFIHDIEDLEVFATAKGRDINEFDLSTTNLEDA